MPSPPNSSSSPNKDAPPSVPFRIKVCGVKALADVDACTASRVDCVGLNFYAPSVRSLDPNASLTKQLNDHARDSGLFRVGLFVNTPVEQALTIAKQLALDAVQFHGDEPPREARKIIDEGIHLIRAIRLPTSPMAPRDLEMRLAFWQAMPITLLLDAYAGAAFGGGGKQLDWETLALWQSNRPPSKTQHATPWVLAGGLTPENIGLAIRASGADAVDVASGVESSKGVKSAEKIAEFAKNAIQAWDEVPGR